jgi:ABC-type sugar transport system ATPase subunit
LADQLSSERIILGFRPEAAQANGRGPLQAEVYASDLHGAFNMMHVSLEEGNVEAMVHIRGERGQGHEIGDHITFDLNPEMARIFDPQTEQAIAVAVE